MHSLNPDLMRFEDARRRTDLSGVRRNRPWFLSPRLHPGRHRITRWRPGCSPRTSPAAPLSPLA